MNLALKDIGHNLGRFLLTCIGLSLLLGIVLAMVGIYRGLILESLGLVRAAGAQVWIVEGDTRGPFAEASQLPGDTRAARVQRLAVGERQLRASAERAATRYSWQRHLLGIATNLAGGAAILALGNRGDAVGSTLVGIAVSELQIWSQPWRPTGDLRPATCAIPRRDSRMRA